MALKKSFLIDKIEKENNVSAAGVWQLLCLLGVLWQADL